jgi:hypothetical protein
LRNAVLILACVIVALDALFSVGKTLRVRYRLNRGDCVLVEGVVSDFVPGGPAGHGDELWRARSGDQDHWYHYSASVSRAARACRRAGSEDSAHLENRRLTREPCSVVGQECTFSALTERL